MAQYLHIVRGTLDTNVPTKTVTDDLKTYIDNNKFPGIVTNGGIIADTDGKFKLSIDNSTIKLNEQGQLYATSALAALGITGAKAGQLVTVTGVDAEGVPTALGSVDFTDISLELVDM